MKQLYINNKRVIIAEDTYFAFTHTISDIENINLIGVPSSKSINIPRCPQNDEIFGYICEISRINSDATDNFIGVSFNQIKKCNYILYNDGEIISEGLILIDNITETEYSITLYDKLIEQIELLGGDAETNEYYLNSCDILINDTPLNVKSTAFGIANINNYEEIKPVICIKDDSFDKKTIRCVNVTGTTTGTTGYEAVSSLPTDCTSLQLRTLKNYEVNYAVSINDMVAAINNKYDDIIEIDNDLLKEFNDLHILTNSPSLTNYNITNNIFPTGVTSDTSFIIPLKNLSEESICIINGHKYFNLEFQITHESSATQVIGYRDYFGMQDPEYRYSTTPDGTIFNKRWIKLNLVSGTPPFTSGDILKSADRYYEIDYIKNVNTTFTVVSSIYVSKITVTANILIDLDFYPNFKADETDSYINVTLYDYDQSYPNYHWKLLDFLSVHQTEFKITSNSKLTETNTQFRTGDYITSASILPKVSIKDFIIQLAKFCNLSIIRNGDKLKLEPKKYYLTTDVLLIDSIDEISTNNITFNKLKLINNLPKSDVLDKYKTTYKTTYGSQIINTGYSIKNNEKSITLEASIPFLLTDVNSYAYDRFTRYYGGGYCKANHGVITDLSDKLVFGYLNTITTNPIYITNDSPFEGGMDTLSITGATEVKFVHYNNHLYNYTQLTDENPGKYLFQGPYSTGTTEDYQLRVLDSYYTFSPYLFNGSTITKSLELNKPFVSYAFIQDTNYPLNTTLYYRFHRNLLIDKYNSNTHILKVKMFVDGVIDIYKIYNYKNSLYIISQIVEYDPTEPGIYEIQLMKVNDLNNYILSTDNNYILTEDNDYTLTEESDLTKLE
jgi:hypothetical protein